MPDNTQSPGMIIFHCLTGIAAIVFIAAVVTFFGKDYNPNSLITVGGINNKPLNDKHTEITYTIANKSLKTLNKISVVIDAYNSKNKIIGTGKMEMRDDFAIKPFTGLNVTMDIFYTANCKETEYYVLIPSSNKGTGKLVIPLANFTQ